MGLVKRIKSLLGLVTTDPADVDVRAPYIGDHVKALVHGEPVEGTVQSIETREEGSWHIHIDNFPEVLQKSEVVEVTTPDERSVLPDHPAFDEPEELPDHPVFEA